MRTTTIFAETHTSERANHVAYRLVAIFFSIAKGTAILARLVKGKILQQKQHILTLC